MMYVPSLKKSHLFVYATSVIVKGVKTIHPHTTQRSSPKNVSHLYDHRVLLLIAAIVVSALDVSRIDSSKHLAATTARIIRVVGQRLKVISLHDDGYLAQRVYLL